jgi:hypothetical protein
MVEPPNTEVYRAAANLIEARRYRYTCLALCQVAHDMNVSPGEYVSQYQRACQSPTQGLPSWWDADFSNENLLYRTKALRDMADLCEGKQVPRPLGRRT